MATSKMLVPLSVATPVSDEFETSIVFPSCLVLVEDKELLVNLVLLDVIDFDVILKIDWLALHYTILDCQEIEVIFTIPNNMEFRFKGDKSSISKNLISMITARKMLRRGY